MGNNPWTALPIAAAALVQTIIAVAVGIFDLPWGWVLLLGYVLGGVLAGTLEAAHHEMSHFLVFKRPFWNRALMIAANAPLAVPLGSMFKQYHHDHHSDMVSGWLVHPPAVPLSRVARRCWRLEGGVLASVLGLQRTHRPLSRDAAAFFPYG
jgi:hypothetical protein